MLKSSIFLSSFFLEVVGAGAGDWNMKRRIACVATVLLEILISDIVQLFCLCFTQDGGDDINGASEDQNQEITESMRLEMEYNSDRAW